MSDERTPIIKPTMDATGVRQGAEDVKTAVRGAARVVESEGRRASEGVEAIGDGAKKGADGLNRETGRMVASIQRAQAAALAGGRQTADYFEALGKQRGLSAEVLQPYLDGLRAAEAAQKAATGSLGTMGTSARQTAAALRNVPAQFTDIVTALQGGQAPLTVFLQQGGQLKDMFGGAGAAAQALGGYVLGLINPFTVLAAVAGVVTVGFIQGSKESQEYAKALILSGNAAGVTAGQLRAIASAIDATSGATESKAAEVLAQLAAAGEVGAANLERFAKAAIELERAGGPAAEATAKAFADLARDPLAASVKLTESTRYLTAAVAEQIAELEKQGKTTEAARLAQDAYAKALEERTPQLVARLGLVERAWKGIKDATKEAGDAILNIGRPTDTLQKEIDVLKQRIAQNTQDREKTNDAGRTAQIDRGTAVLTQRLRLLQQGQAYEALDAAYAAQRVEREEAGVRWLKEGEKYLSNKQRLSAEIAKIQTEGAKAGISEALIAERVAAARERANGKADAKAERDRNSELEQQLRLVAELSGVSGTYVQDLQRLDAARRSGLVGDERYIELVTELISKQPMVRDQMQDMARAAKAQAAAVLQAEEAWARYVVGLDQNVEAGNRTLQQLQLELVELTAGKQARFELEQLERERLALTYDQTAAAAELDRTDSSRYRKLADQVREEIRLRKQVNEATTSNEVKKANLKAAEDAAKDWDRTAGQIGQSLADALFEGGKSAGDLLKGYFRTLILKPIIDATFKPLVNEVGAALGLPGAGGAGGVGGSGLVSNAASALGLGKTAGATASGFISQASMLASVFVMGNAIGKAIGGGYSIGGKIGDNLGGLIGGVPGGVINRLFGRKLKDTGFEGSFGTEGDFSGNAFQFLKGGLLRSDKTKRSPLDEQLAQVLDAGGAAAFAQAQAYAEVLGLPVAAMADYTQKVKVSLKGLSEEQAQAAVEKAVQDYQEGLLGRFSAQLQPLRRVGETLSEVAGRVAELTVFTRGINELGGVFNRVAGLSIDAREQLIGFAGGMEALNSQALSFAQQYYNRDEIAGVKAREIQGVLSAAGISQDVATREQFRALVEGADVSTAAGREQLAQLLRIAGDFAEVADYLAETGGTLAGAASLAPSTGALAEVFSAPAQAQVTAINAVTSAVNVVDASINRMAEMFADLQRYNSEVMGGA
jgi:phage-related minor tail protein